MRPATISPPAALKVLVKYVSATIQARRAVGKAARPFRSLASELALRRQSLPRYSDREVGGVRAGQQPLAAVGLGQA
jgi:hypothetical protein